MKSVIRVFAPFLMLILVVGRVWGLEPEEGSVFIRVIDTGAALCCVIKTNDGQYLIYDAGHWAGDGWRAFDGLQQIIPANQPIASMVLSHTDSDHLGGVKKICDGYYVQEIVWPGLSRDSGTWDTAQKAIRKECNREGCVEINLQKHQFPAGDYYFGETKVSFLCGWCQPPASWPLEGSQDSGEFFNAGSIVIRIEYAGKSVLFCGDAVGRHKSSPAGTCIATEKYLCDHAAERPIRSEVIIAPHHGGNNASTERFIQTVAPQWVIFSAGHNYHHPTRNAAQRYLDYGIDVSHILRTDRGDDEKDEPNKEPEWKNESNPSHQDQPGDDDVDILIKPNGQLTVAYRNPDPADGTLKALPFAPNSVKRMVPEYVLRAEAMAEEEPVLREQKQTWQCEPVRRGLFKRWCWHRRCR